MLTPQLRTDRGATTLLHVDLSGGAGRLGGSAIAQVHGKLGAVPADLDDPALLVALSRWLTALRQDGLALAWHDVSDGGVIVTLLEMAFTNHTKLNLS